MSIFLSQKNVRRHGSVLIEVSLGFALTATLALAMMRSSLVAISGNQWTVMQTLTDSYLSRESALSNRIPYADLTSAESPWPVLADAPVSEQTVTIGRVAGGHLVEGTLRRFRTAEILTGSETFPSLWRLHSVLSYNVGSMEYVKSRSTLRMQ